MMNQFYRDPQVEDGIHNVVLQNRCGNRCTLLCREDRCELEFSYKPNAMRRRDFRARNFSNRDIFTGLFRGVCWPDLSAGDVKLFDYDPFHTRLETATSGRARNWISLLNVADENVFALSAR